MAICPLHQGGANYEASKTMARTICGHQENHRRIRHECSGKRLVVHRNRLRPCTSEDQPKQTIDNEQQATTPEVKEKNRYNPTQHHRRQRQHQYSGYSRTTRNRKIGRTSRRRPAARRLHQKCARGPDGTFALRLDYWITKRTPTSN